VKVTYNWLEEFVDIPWSPEELADKLTLSGSEVEVIGQVESIFENLVIGRIVKVKNHPDAKHLKVCMVDLGNNRETIVCGAPNVRAGLNVVTALPGSVLPSGLAINVAKIRGVVSGGMICSERELGFSDIADVIMEMPDHHKPGEQFDPGHFADDVFLDIFINPNRPDCMSIYGLAREIAALSGKKLRDRPITLPKTKKLDENGFEIIIKDTEKCPRYSGAIITGIHVRPSPYELQQRLVAVGIRPINNIVDATNYCLVEWGHPLHAFDFNNLDGRKIVVKTAKRGQKFTTLDGVVRTLNEEILLICDRDKPVAIGGIMGGANSEIQNNTTDVFIECAYFQPKNILRSSKFLGLSTEASHRFERGMDPNFCLTALKRVCALILRLSPGQLHTPFFDIYPKRYRKKRVTLRPARLNAVLGTDFSDVLMRESLNSLGIASEKSGGVIKTKIPTFRHDISREIDLIEEVARIVGLDKINPELYATIPMRNVVNPDMRTVSRLRSIMTEFGFMEAYTYSLIDQKLEPFFQEFGDALFLKNPISPELSMLRQSLIPGLLNAAIHNYNRGIENLRIFELGTVFSRDPVKIRRTREALHLGAVIYGQRVPPSWDHLDTPCDFFSIKGIIESLFQKISLDKIEFISYDSHYLEESSSITYNGNSIGYIGRYRNVSLFIDFPEPLFLFEIETEDIREHIRKPKYYYPYSKYPPAKRDLAFVIPESLHVQNVANFLQEAGGSLLKSIVLEDVYRGEQIAFDSRSVKFSLKFCADERSLLDEEVDALINTIIKAVQEKFNITIRQ